MTTVRHFDQPGERGCGGHGFTAESGVAEKHGEDRATLGARFDERRVRDARRPIEPLFSVGSVPPRLRVETVTSEFSVRQR